MKGETLLVTMADIKRYRILEDAIEMRLKWTEADQPLNLDIVHMSRVKQRLRA